MSGTFEALVYDELKHFGDQHDYARIIGRISVCSSVGLLLAAAAAVPMIRLGYRAVILASLVPLAVSSAAALRMRPANRVESTGEVGYIGLLREGVREGIRNRIVLRLITFLSFALVFGALDEYYTLFFRAAGMPMSAIGILCAGLTAVQTVGDAVAYRFMRLPNMAFFVAYLASGGLVLIAARFLCPISVVSIFVLCLVIGITAVVMETRLQHSIQGRARATVVSVKGFADNVACVALFLAFGAVARKSGYQGGFVACGGAMVVIGLLYILSEHRRTRSRRINLEVKQEAKA